VSAAVAQLEGVLGVQLLIRHHAKGVSPTPAGRRFLTRARALLLAADELERFTAELREGLSGPLEVGCYVPISSMVTPQLCREFSLRHPAVSIELVETSQQQLVDGLRSGRLSLGLTYDFGLPDDIAFESLAELPPHALLPPKHPLASRREVTVEDLAKEPFILLDLPVSRDYLRSLFLAEGLDVNVAHRSPRPEVIRTMVANDYGVTIINARPQFDRTLDGREVRTVRLAGTPRSIALGIARLDATRLTRVAEAFQELCRDQITADSIPGLRTGDK
jgi:DNA-binding transcriptional LysR family regulator